MRPGKTSFNAKDGKLTVLGLQVFPECRIAGFPESSRPGDLFTYRERKRDVLIKFPRVTCGDVTASVRVYLRSDDTVVVVCPYVSGFHDGKDVLEASKKWIFGLVPKKYFSFTENAFEASFPWGEIRAEHDPSRDRGIDGGEIYIYLRKAKREEKTA